MSDESQIQTKSSELRTFSRRVLGAGVVWGIYRPEGWCTAPLPGARGQVAMPLWSDRARAARFAREEWGEEAELSFLQVEELCTSWLPGLEEDGVKVGLDWSPGESGAAVEAAQVLECLAPPLDFTASASLAAAGLLAGQKRGATGRLNKR